MKTIHRHKSQNRHKNLGLGPLLAGISVATIICVAPSAEAQIVKFKDGQNIKVSRRGNDVTVATKDDLTAKSVTVGNTRVDTDGLQAGDGGKNLAVYGASGAGVTDGDNGASLTANGVQTADRAGNRASYLSSGISIGDGTNTMAVGAAGLQAGDGGTNLTVVNSSGMGVDDGKNTSAFVSTGVETSDGDKNSASYRASGMSVTDGTKTTAVGANGLQADDGGANLAIYDSYGVGVTDGKSATEVLATGVEVNDGANNRASYRASGMSATDGTNTTSVGAAGLQASDGGKNLVVVNSSGMGVDDGKNTTAFVSTGVEISDGDKNNASYRASGLSVDDGTNRTALDAKGLTIGNGPSVTIAGIDGGGKTITNLATGAIGNGSTDAVNGAQVFASSQSVADALGGGAKVQRNGTLSRPAYVIGSSSYDNVGDTFGAVDRSLTSLTGQVSSISSGGGIKYFHSNSTLADAQATGKDSVATGGAAVATGASSVATGNGAQAKADNAVALGAGASANHAGDVALGSGSTTEAAVQTSTMEVNGKTYSVAGTATSTVSVGAAGAERTITNVAAGRVNAGSTDAVNGSQLYATNQEVASIGQQVGTVGAVAKNSVQYDTDGNGKRKNSITLQGGDANAPVVLSNVATGKSDTDAVNVRQLKDVSTTTLASANGYTDTKTLAAISTANSYTDTRSSQTLASANAYTDQKFGMLSSSIGEVRNEARQAAAIGLAASSLRYDDRPGKISAAVGGGVWRGQGAFAMGLGYTSDEQNMRANVSATTAGGQWGVGAGLSFTFN